LIRVIFTLITMKYYITLFLFFALSHSLLAQDEKAAYIAKYKYAVVADTNYRSNVYRESMELLIGKKSSLFKSYDQFQKDSVISAQQTLNMKVFADSRRYTDDQVLTIYNGTKGYTSKSIGIRYFWEIAIPQYNWEIKPETMDIAGYKCQKATMISPKTNKRYVAWFNSEIPIPAGPSYFSGLPGLIMLVEDENKTMRMELYYFGNATPGNDLVSFGKRAIKTTKEDYNKALAAYKSDPAGFLKSSGALGGSISEPTITDKPDKN
jgi:GLPGLI family protein